MIKKPILLIIILVVLLTGCFEPEVVSVLTFDGKANMTIAEFRQLHTLTTDLPPTLIEDDIIITGIVISTDEYGSSYQELFIQDSTGGISICISNSAYYKNYPIGRQVFVKTKGLYLGNYISSGRYGYYQLGLYGNINGKLQDLSPKKEAQHLFPSGILQAPPAPKTITNEKDMDVDHHTYYTDYHTLVKLVNCRFTDADGTATYSNPSFSTTNRNIVFNGGSGTVTARISKYCTFANDILPTGALNIKGILTMFGTTQQLIICSATDVQQKPVEKILKNYDMHSDPFSLGWTNKSMQGATIWKYNSGNPGYMSMEALSGNETECWFVSPKFNFSGEKDIAISFKYRIINGAKDNVNITYTIDGTNWQSLAFTPNIGATSQALIKLPDNVATNPNLQIAFQYKTTTLYPTWLINEIVVMGNVGM